MCILQVVGNDSISSDIESASEKDNDVSEVRVAFEKVSKNAVIPGKVASLQKRFEVSHKGNGMSLPVALPNSASSNSSASIDNRQLLLKLSNDKSSSPSDSSGYDSLRSNNSNVNHELDARLAQALEENDKMFRSFDTLKRKQIIVAEETHSDDDSKTPSVMSRVKTFNSAINIKPKSSIPGPTRPSTLQRPPSSAKKGEEKVPPPPPPRLPMNKMHTLANPKKSNYSIENAKVQRSVSISTSNLSKSASQGDIAVKSSTNTNSRSPSKSNNSSISNEDLRNSKTSPGSPSKQSMASSNDSLTSSSSAVTVKSASLKSLDKEDDPPELPPRNGTLKSSKPPIPRSPSQVSFYVIFFSFWCNKTT